MYFDDSWALVIPLANEASGFAEFSDAIAQVLERLRNGTVYFVVDRVSRDNTLSLCTELSARDPRFKTVWAPENRNVVDAYVRGYREAFEAGHDIMIEMDAGFSHDPRAIPMFLRVLNEGNECAFGSRFVNGGSMADSPFFRRFLSRGGTLLANALLGTRLHDMTSGFQGFRRPVVERLLAYPLRSRAHFYQTEVRYLLRNKRHIEVPIHYQSPSPNVSRRAIQNSLAVLIHYFLKRIRGLATAL